MNNRSLRTIASAAGFVLCGLLHAQPEKEFTPFTQMGNNAAESFSGMNMLLHSSAIAATYMLVYSSADYRVHDYFSQHSEIDPYTVPAVYMGYTLPLLAGGGLYLSGKNSGSAETAAAGCAVLQASGIALAYSSLLKALTGRPNPGSGDMKEESRRFRFGIARGGIHYGWPSGHLAVNTAAAASLMAFYPDNNSLKIIGGIYLAYLFISVSAHEGATMHWFSDVVAGTLIGLAIGPAVGKNFRQLYNGAASKDAAYRITPLLSPAGTGISVSVML